MGEARRQSNFRRPSLALALTSWVLAVLSIVFDFTLWGRLFPRLSSNDTWGFLPLFAMIGFFVLGLILFAVWLAGVASRPQPVAGPDLTTAGRPATGLRRAAVATWVLAAVAFVFSVTVGPYISSGTLLDFVPILLAAALFVLGVVLFLVWAARPHRPATG